MILIILWNDKIRKVNDIFKAVDNELAKRDINVDGTVETFNDGIEQGMVLKIFNKYNPNLDICVWTYLPKDRDCNNQIKIVVAKQSDCLPNNLWTNEITSEIITESKVKDMHNKAREYIIDVVEKNFDKKYSLKI